MRLSSNLVGLIFAAICALVVLGAKPSTSVAAQPQVVAVNPQTPCPATPSPTPSYAPTPSPTPIPTPSLVAAPTSTPWLGAGTYEVSNLATNTLLYGFQTFTGITPVILTGYNGEVENGNQYNNVVPSTWAGLDPTNTTAQGQQLYPGYPALLSLTPYPSTDTCLTVLSDPVAAANWTRWAKEWMAMTPPFPDGNYYVRPMWEMPGTYYEWGANCKDHPSNYVADIEAISNAFKAVSPTWKVVIDTNASGYGTGCSDMSCYFPPNNYYDVVSEDVYWQVQYGPSTATAAYQARVGQPTYSSGDVNGMQWHATFAAAHSKPNAFSEWACEITSDICATFMTDMAGWMASVPTLYEISWDQTFGEPQIWFQFPNTVAAFQSAFVPSATYVIPSPTPAPSPSPSATPTPLLCVNPNAPTYIVQNGTASLAITKYQADVLALRPSLFYKTIDASGTTAVDATGNANNGTYVGTVLLDRAGPNAGNGSASLDGSTGYISTTYIPTSASAFTVLLYASYYAATAYPSIANVSGPLGTEGFNLYFTPIAGQLAAGITTAGGVVYVSMGSGLPENAFFFGALTVNGQAATLYVNGSQVATTNLGAAYVPSGYPLKIGAKSNGGIAGGAFPGSIGGPVFLDGVALNAQQIAQLANDLSL